MVVKEHIKYLIIGNSAGAIGAVEAIRRLDQRGSITIVSDEPYHVYSRPLISEHLADHRPLEEMLYRPADFYEKLGVQAILGEKVAQIDFKEHTAKLENGQVLTWRKLLLATGGTPIIPDIEGADLKGIFTFNKIDDAKAIDSFLAHGRGNDRAVVIGGGLIGVSATEALVKRGVHVTMVEMQESILNMMLDEEAAALEAEALAGAGVSIITGHTAVKINGHLDAVNGVNLDDGQTLPCELVLIAVGVRPRLELAKGLKTNRGIVVDRHMATSLPDVYACGDVAEAHDFVYGENRLTPIWPNAYTGGKIAGMNMAGTKVEYPGGTAMNALKYFGVNIVSAGLVRPPDDSYEVISRRHNSDYRKVILKKGRLAGLVFTGDIEKSGIVYNLMKDGVNVSRFKQALVADDFGIASLPAKIRRARLAEPSTLEDGVTSLEEPEELPVGD